MKSCVTIINKTPIQLKHNEFLPNEIIKTIRGTGITIEGGLPYIHLRGMYLVTCSATMRSLKSGQLGIALATETLRGYKLDGEKAIQTVSNENQLITLNLTTLESMQTDFKILKLVNLGDDCILENSTLTIIRIDR